MLRSVRERGGVTVRRLAKDLGRAHSTISDFENGRRLPGVEVVEQYEDRFGLGRGTLGAHRERARAARLETPRDATVDENLGDVTCPYMGLRAFEHQDAELFFGREAQVQDALALLAEVGFVAVVGASGSGKSSFVHAGVLAKVARTPTASLTPGARPLDALAAAVSAALASRSGVTATELRADPAHLASAVRKVGGGLMVVVDQLEELFTLCGDDVERRCFADALMAAWRDPGSHVAVIVALRADLYGRVAAHADLAAAVVAHQVLISPMSPADLRRAIELPAARSGFVLQPGLADAMLEDLADEPGALPLLSQALLETWKRRRRLMLTVGAYHEAGGVRAAIAQSAERTLGSLPAGDLPAARSIFLSLVDIAEEGEPTCRRIDRAELVSHETARRERVLGILAGARLVTLDERTVTVAHEALIRHWPRLRGWIEADRVSLLVHARLRDAARQWDSLEREPAALYRGARLATAQAWSAEHADQLGELERDFLAASRSREHSERRSATRRAWSLRGLVAGLAVLTMIVATLAVSAVGERDDAHRRQTTRTSLALVSAASHLLRSRPDISLLLALQAMRTRPSARARSAVVAALVAARDPGVVAILHGHSAAVGSVAFGPRGLTIASGGDDGTIRLWDARTHKQLAALPAQGSVSNIAASRDGRTLASAGPDGVIRLWDVRTHRELARPGDLTNSVGTMAFSRDGRRLAYPTTTHKIRVWDVRGRKAVGAAFESHTGFVHSLAFSPGGHTLATAGNDNAIRLWNLRTHRQLGAPLRGRNLTGTLSFSPNGHTLAAAGDETIRLWDVRTHRPRGRPLRGHTDLVTSVMFAPDGRSLASTSYDRTIRVWSTRTHEQLGAPLAGHHDSVNAAAFSPDGQTLASASDDHTVRLWQLRRAARPGVVLDARARGLKSVAFSPDGSTLAAAGDDGALRLWDARTHKRRGPPLAGHDGAVQSVAFSPDGRLEASAGDDWTIRLWDVRAHKRLGAPLSGHEASVERVVFSPTGRTLASASDDTTIRLWDVRTHKQLGAPLTGHAGPVESLAFSPTGSRLASASDDTTVRLWDTRTHEQLGIPMTGHTSLVSGVAFSPDGSALASGSDDRTVRLWDVRTHRQLGAPLRGHTGAVRGVAFSPDGRTLASAGTDAKVRLWDVRAHHSLGPPLAGHAGPVEDVAFAPDGRTLASAGGDGRLRLWGRILWSKLSDVERMACQLVGGRLSRREWTQFAAGITHAAGESNPCGR